MNSDLVSLHFVKSETQYIVIKLHTSGMGKSWEIHFLEFFFLMRKNFAIICFSPLSYGVPIVFLWFPWIGKIHSYLHDIVAFEKFIKSLDSLFSLIVKIEYLCICDRCKNTLHQMYW